MINTANIGGLTELNELYIGGSQLTNINITNLNKLKNLEIQFNTQITTLTISNLENLEDIRCGYNENLTYLKISNLKNLKVIWCDWCQLSNLNTQVSDLEYFDEK